MNKPLATLGAAAAGALAMYYLDPELGARRRALLADLVRNGLPGERRAGGRLPPRYPRHPGRSAHRRRTARPHPVAPGPPGEPPGCDPRRRRQRRGAPERPRAGQGTRRPAGAGAADAGRAEAGECDGAHDHPAGDRGRSDRPVPLGSHEPLGSAARIAAHETHPPPDRRRRRRRAAGPGAVAVPALLGRHRAGRGLQARLAWYRVQVARGEAAEQFFGDAGEDTRPDQLPGRLARARCRSTARSPWGAAAPPRPSTDQPPCVRAC